ELPGRRGRRPRAGGVRRGQLRTPRHGEAAVRPLELLPSESECEARVGVAPSKLACSTRTGSPCWGGVPSVARWRARRVKRLTIEPARRDYNLERSHPGHRLGGRTPAQALRDALGVTSCRRTPSPKERR